MSTQTRILIVGTGGTGCDALLHAKALFRDAHGGIPSFVKFLHFDTVHPRALAGESLGALEFVYLPLRDPAAILENPENSYLKQWFPGRTSIDVRNILSGNGAAQIRPLGRLALHSQPDFVRKRIASCIGNLTDVQGLRDLSPGETVNEQGATEVYILSSLCGGTGSGIFIDVAQLIKEQLSNAPSVSIYGIFLLPGPFSSLAATAFVKSNAYAALKELEQIASLSSPLEFTFGAGRTSEIKSSPFRMVYLVDSVSEPYDTTADQQQLARQMAYLPYLMAMPSIGARVRETLCNLLPQMESNPLVHGKRATYASFGVATLEIPTRSVGAAKIEFARGMLVQLIGGDAEIASLGDLGIDEALARCRPARVPENVKMLLPEDFTHPRMPVGRLEAGYRDAIMDVEDYARKLSTPRLQALRDAASQAIKRSLAEAASRPGCLPSAEREYCGLEKRLKQRQESLRAPSENAANNERNLADKWELCKQAYESRRRRVRRRAALEWEDVVNRLILQDRLVQTVNEAAADALGYIADQIRSALDWRRLAHRNLTAAEMLLPQKTEPAPSPSPFTRYCDASPIRPAADAAAFLSQTGGAPSWFENSAAAILDAVYSFADEMFKTIFVAGGPGSATRLIERDPAGSMGELRRFSDPLWNFSLDKIPGELKANIQHLHVIGIDRYSSAISAMAGQYHGVTFVPTDKPDRVVSLQIRMGAPLFALSCFDDLWLHYSRQSERHENERFHIDRRWACFPELLPHAFHREPIELLARGMAASILIRSGNSLELRNGGAPLKLGETFAGAYRCLARDQAVAGIVSQSLQSAAIPDFVGMEAGMWKLLSNGHLPAGDRPYVEALARWFERMKD